ncbi:MAG: M20/M25/M40 family metallo-hydrolase [Thermomicrobiales bacterium]
MTDVARVIEAARERREYSEDVLRKLLRASRDGEEPVQRAVVLALRDLGWEVEALNRRPGVLNIQHEFAGPSEIDDRPRRTIVGGPPNRKLRSSDSRLLLWAHPDGMPFDGAADWAHDPFEGVVQDGRMYGWGVADDLSGVAAMIAVAAVLNDLDVDSPQVAVASTPSKGHASGVVAALGALGGVRAGIYLHPAESGRGLEDIKAVAPGMLRFELTVKGRQPDTREPNHTLFVDEGADPIRPMLKILDALETFNESRKGWISSGSPITMMVGTFHAGESISRMPKDCRAVVTFSMPPGESLEGTRRAIEGIVSRVSDADDWAAPEPATIEWLFGTAGVEVSESHPLYTTVSQAITQVTGSEPRHYGGHIASEIRQPMLNHGIPSLGIGPRSGSLTQAGATADEWLDLDDFNRMIAVCAISALNWSRGTIFET